MQPGTSWHLPWHQLVQAPSFLYFSTFNCSIFLAWQKEEGGPPWGDNSSALLNLQDQIVLAQIGHSQLASKQPILVENNTMANSPSENRALSQLPAPTGRAQAPPSHLCPSVTDLPPKCATSKCRIPPRLCSGLAGPCAWAACGSLPWGHKPFPSACSPNPAGTGLSSRLHSRTSVNNHPHPPAWRGAGRARPQAAGLGHAAVPSPRCPPGPAAPHSHLLLPWLRAEPCGTRAAPLWAGGE